MNFKEKEIQYGVFEYLNGKKVSALIDNPKPSGPKESYVGYLQNTDGDWIYLDTSEGNKKIRGIFIRKDFILSIWEY